VLTVTIDQVDGSYQGLPDTRGHTLQILGMPQDFSPESMQIVTVNGKHVDNWSVNTQVSLSTPAFGALLIESGPMIVGSTTIFEVMWRA